MYTTSPVDVSMGDTFTISLEANPSTGYSWELTGPLDDKVVVELGSDHQPGEGTAVGVPGHQLFRSRRSGKGTATIGLQYVRPWETGVAPAKTSEFTSTSVAWRAGHRDARRGRPTRRSPPW